MPPRKKQKVTGKERSSIVTPEGASEYRRFLNTKIFPVVTGKKGKPISQNEIAGWQEPPPGDEGVIINEIAKKFNSAPLGISKAIYKPGGPSSSTFYGSNQEYRPELSLVPRNHMKYGPNPLVIAHELVHASDHQGQTPVDRLNPLVWKNLQALVTSKSSMEEFANSIKRIQDKIDIPGDFGKAYPINSDYITTDIKRAQNDSYTIPETKGIPDWPQLFNNISSVVTAPAVDSQTVPNQGFYLNRASEFPAFMSENLTRRWHTNEGETALTHPQARFLHKTLGNMSDSYHATDPTTGDPAYPIINHHITARRNSLAQAYYPPTTNNPSGGPPPGTDFSHGGRVKNKNLLSKFKKIRHKII